jgi:very-short-patch-repair endonuclease
MSELITLNFENHNVRFVEGKPVANDVAAVLGYADPQSTISKKVFPQNKGVAKMQTPGGTQSVVVLEKPGVLQLVSSSRLPQAIDIAKEIGLFVLSAFQEQDLVRIIEAAFADLQPVRQFTVHGYRIDLYLAKVNIAIECDEHGHSQYNNKNEDIREKRIKSALGCSFVRFNPNEPGFNLGDVILAIRELV